MLPGVMESGEQKTSSVDFVLPKETHYTRNIIQIKYPSYSNCVDPVSEFSRFFCKGLHLCLFIQNVHNKKALKLQR